jgi:polyisoprenoid-binding protein YceI
MAITNWALDPAHSEVGFKVRHLMVTNVSGSFDIFSINVETDDENFSNAKVEFSADVNSINTGSGDRDQHLKSSEFFDAEKYPKVLFTTTGYENVDHDGSYEMTGDLTMHGVTKPIKLSVEFGGVIKDPWGNIKAGFTINGKINRKDFGLNWNALLETGGVMLNEEVRINCEIQLIKRL